MTLRAQVATYERTESPIFGPYEEAQQLKRKLSKSLQWL